MKAYNSNNEGQITFECMKNTFTVDNLENAILFLKKVYIHELHKSIKLDRETYERLVK